MSVYMLKMKHPTGSYKVVKPNISGVCDYYKLDERDSRVAPCLIIKITSRNTASKLI